MSRYLPLRLCAFVGALSVSACLSMSTDENASGNSTTPSELSTACTQARCVIVEGVAAIEAARSGRDSTDDIVLAEVEIAGGDTIAISATYAAPLPGSGALPVVEVRTVDGVTIGVLRPSSTSAGFASFISGTGPTTIRFFLRRDAGLSPGGQLTVLQRSNLPPLDMLRKFPVSSPRIGFFADGGTTSCQFRAPTTVCGVTVGIIPYYPISAHGPDNWQSREGTGQSLNVAVTFSSPVDSFTIVVWDSDFQGNHVIAKNASGAVLVDVPIPFDGTPNVLTADTVRIGAAGIASVSLVAVTGDYISYSGAGFFRTCPPLNDPLANDSGFQAFARGLLDSSLAGVDTVEKLGLVFLDPTSGQLSFVQDIAATSTACSVTGQPPADTPTQQLVGRVHTHPWVPGRLLVCGPNLDLIRYRFKDGGGSVADWENADSLSNARGRSIPSYTLDDDGDLAKLSPGTAASSRPANPYIWKDFGDACFR